MQRNSSSKALQRKKIESSFFAHLLPLFSRCVMLLAICMFASFLLLLKQHSTRQKSFLWTLSYNHLTFQDYSQIKSWPKTHLNLQQKQRADRYSKNQKIWVSEWERKKTKKKFASTLLRLYIRLMKKSQPYSSLDRFKYHDNFINPPIKIS